MAYGGFGLPAEKLNIEDIMGIPLIEAYGHYMKEMIKISKAPDKIDETNIYQESNPALLEYCFKMMDETLRKDSCLGNIENWKAFYDAVTKEGKSGVIMMEHFTNIDLPSVIYLLDKHGEDWSKDFAKRIVAIAGMKLNEANPAVRCWTEAFTRVVIYPTRSLDKVENSDVSEEQIKAEAQKAKKINFAAMRQMDSCKRKGQIILVFPSGTRYRPGHPETKRGLREIDSYLRLFDVMILVSNNGNCLRINMENPDDMLADFVEHDKIVLTASPVIECKKFRDEVLAALPAQESDPKQKTVDKVMEILEVQHEKAEAGRLA